MEQITITDAGFVPPSASEPPMLQLSLQGVGDGWSASEGVRAFADENFTMVVLFSDAHELLVRSLKTSRTQPKSWVVREVAIEELRNNNLLPDPHRESFPVHSNRLIASAISMARQSIDKELKLRTVADQLHINSSYLSRLFKRETGRTFSEYCTGLKMEKAKQLLQSGARVYEAARGVGFKDVGHFRRLFRKHWGAAPIDLAKEC